MAKAQVTIRRCDDHQCAIFDEECGQGARSRDASDEEGRPLVFRHEGASGRRQPNQADPCGGGDTGQCRRRPGLARTAAWRGNPCLGRSGLSRSARRDPPESAAGAGFHQPPLSSPRRRSSRSQSSILLAARCRCTSSNSRRPRSCSSERDTQGAAQERADFLAGLAWQCLARARTGWRNVRATLRLSR